MDKPLGNEGGEAVTLWKCEIRGEIETKWLERPPNAGGAFTKHYAMPYYAFDALLARLRDARREALEEAASIADTEEELDGPMPVEARAALEKSGPEALLRAAVRATKRSIAAKLRALATAARGVGDRPAASEKS